jgi:hypothetical protein
VKQPPLFDLGPAAAPPAPSPEWTPSQLARKARAGAGECVVANCSGPRFQPARMVDAALVAWAKSAGRYVFIGRPSRWQNPFKMDHKHTVNDGDRAAVMAKFAEHTWPAMQDAIRREPDLFVGKVCGCFCAPLPCHGDLIAAFVNGGCR